jgi:prepilin-type N-terminal cleavage/methylation domain-containing protein
MTSSPGNRRAARGARCPGFTLAELLTVMALIALIGGLSASAYQVARRNYSIQASAGRIQGILRAARNGALTTGGPTSAVIDPITRTATAYAFERVGEWSFEDLEGDGSTGISIRRESNHGGTAVEGRVGKGVSFPSAASYYDCGADARFDLRSGILIEAWVRHFGVTAVKPPKSETKPRTSRVRLGAGKRPSDSGEAAAAIVKKDGAYALGMTRSGALEGSIGAYRVRTDDGVVLAERWVHVELRYDGQRIELSADGVPREAYPLEKATLAAASKDAPGGPRPPGSAPVTPAPLTISDSTLSFPGEIDEVRLGGSAEPVAYSWPEHERVIGWKKVIHFDRLGHLDAAYHPAGIRIVLAEVADDVPGKTGATAVAVDYSSTFEDWVAKWDKPPEMSQSAEEARLEAQLAGVRTAVIEIDRLGVIQ